MTRKGNVKVDISPGPRTTGFGFFIVQIGDGLSFTIQNTAEVRLETDDSGPTALGGQRDKPDRQTDRQKDGLTDGRLDRLTDALLY